MRSFGRSDLPGLHVDDRHALVAVAVGDVRLVVRFVERDLRDAVERPHVVAAGVGVREAELLDELAVLGELQDVAVDAGAVAADPEIAFTVGRDAVVRFRPLVALARPAPRAHEIARGIEFEHRRRRLAALRRGRIRGRVDLFLLERRAAMNDVDVILRVDADADRVAKQPVVAHGLGPHRVDLELRRHHLAGGLSGGARERSLPDGEDRQERHERAPNQELSRLHAASGMGESIQFRQRCFSCFRGFVAGLA